MKKISYHVRKKLQDKMYHDWWTEDMVKAVLMEQYRYPARLARKEARAIENEACDYWVNDNY